MTAGLYLELGDVDPEAYAARRAPELLARAGVERVSWWANNVPGRDELPMAVVDGALLGVAEVTGDFVAPEALAGTTAQHFRRFPRPSQGILSGEPTTGLLVVWLSPQSAEQAQAVRDWGTSSISGTSPPPGSPASRRSPRTRTPTPPPRARGPASCTSTSSTPRTPKPPTWPWPGTWPSTCGGSRTRAFEVWADWKAADAQVMYCNTFRLLGSARDVADLPAPGGEAP